MSRYSAFVFLSLAMNFPADMLFYVTLQSVVKFKTWDYFMLQIPGRPTYPRQRLSSRLSSLQWDQMNSAKSTVRYYAAPLLWIEVGR